MLNRGTGPSLWQELQRLQRDMEGVFADVTPAWRWPLTGEYPPINITRDEGGIGVDALCPGVDRATLDVTVVGDALTIRGERKPPADVTEDRFHRRERPLGSFTRTVAFGEPLDHDRTQATYTNGILRLRLSRAPEAQPKKIAIQG
jgi:HSP20 family protein